MMTNLQSPLEQFEVYPPYTLLWDGAFSFTNFALFLVFNFLIFLWLLAFGPVSFRLLGQDILLFAAQMGEKANRPGRIVLFTVLRLGLCFYMFTMVLFPTSWFFCLFVVVQQIPFINFSIFFLVINYFVILILTFIGASWSIIHFQLGYLSLPLPVSFLINFQNKLTNVLPVLGGFVLAGVFFIPASVFDANTFGFSSFRAMAIWTAVGLGVFGLAWKARWETVDPLSLPLDKQLSAARHVLFSETVTPADNGFRLYSSDQSRVRYMSKSLDTVADAESSFEEEYLSSSSSYKFSVWQRELKAIEFQLSKTRGLLEDPKSKLVEGTEQLFLYPEQTRALKALGHPGIPDNLPLEVRLKQQTGLLREICKLENDMAKASADFKAVFGDIITNL